MPDEFDAADYFAPVTRLEKKLAQIWSRELGLERISLNQDFFDAGGHSLSAARVVTTVNHLFGREISLQSFYSQPTLAGLSDLITRLPRIKPEKQKNTARNIRLNRLPLSDFQFTLWLSKLFEPKAKNLNIGLRRRMLGHPDIKRLQKAFANVLKKHEVFSYRISRFHAAQTPRKNLSFELEIKSLQNLNSAQVETLLEESMSELNACQKWPEHRYLLRARIFYLDDGHSEIQLAMPHIIADENSLYILMDDLSEFYLNSAAGQTAKDISWREYLVTEKKHCETGLKQDIIFWDNYLADARLFHFPEHLVLHGMQDKNYSTYLEIPEHVLNDFYKFCNLNHVSMNDALSGILLKSLDPHCRTENQDKIFCINRVKSTRDDPRYDKTIGCFLNIEPVKLKLDSRYGILELCHEIRQSALHTSPHQKCPNLIKLSSIGTFSQQKSLIKEYAAQLGIWFYNRLFSSFRVAPEIVQRCIRLMAAKDNRFLININVHSNFLHNRAEDRLFGFNPSIIQNVREELSNINNLFDVCFLRGCDHKPYLVISANLPSGFRKELGLDFIRLLSKTAKEYGNGLYGHRQDHLNKKMNFPLPVENRPVL